MYVYKITNHKEKKNLYRANGRIGPGGRGRDRESLIERGLALIVGGNLATTSCTGKREIEKRWEGEGATRPDQLIERVEEGESLRLREGYFRYWGTRQHRRASGKEQLRGVGMEI